MPWGTSMAAAPKPRPSIGSGGMWVGAGEEATPATPARTFPTAKGPRARAPSQAARFAADLDPSEAPEGDVVATVKELQRTDPGAREQWGLYCEKEGGGVRDPNKHPTAFLNNFIALYHSGGLAELAFQDAAQTNNLGLFVKEGQRRSSSWKQAWTLYCQSYGNGINDPLKHDRTFIINFLDFLGQRGVAAFGTMGGGAAPMGAMPNGGADGDRPSKRLRPSAAPGVGMGFVPGGTGDAEKDALVTRVKAFQRSGETQRQMWWDYCDERFNGIRDPAKHDKNLLEAFLAANQAS